MVIKGKSVSPAAVKWTCISLMRTIFLVNLLTPVQFSASWIFILAQADISCTFWWGRWSVYRWAWRGRNAGNPAQRPSRYKSTRPASYTAWWGFVAWCWRTGFLVSRLCPGTQPDSYQSSHRSQSPKIQQYENKEIARLSQIIYTYYVRVWW